MKVPYAEDIASHSSSESCVVMGNHGCEALTGGGAGQVLSREIPKNQGADVVERAGRQNCMQRYCELSAGPARSETLCMHPSTLYGSWEIPRLTRSRNGDLVRIGKPKGLSR